MQQMPLQSSQNQFPGQTQLYGAPTHISAGKSLKFPFFALELLQNTPVFAGPCLPSPCGPQWAGSWRQASVQPYPSPGPARHGHMLLLLLLFLLLKREAKIAHGTCNAKIPGAFWPARGMALLTKLFPGSPVDLGKGTLALSKRTAPKYSCHEAGLVAWYAQGRQAGSCLEYQWHVLAENHHCMLSLIWLSFLVLIFELA